MHKWRDGLSSLNDDEAEAFERSHAFRRERDNGGGPRPFAPIEGEDTGAKEPPADPTRKDLLLSAWITRELPLRDYLLGNVFCTTSRWLIFGDTGVGKTLFAGDMAGAMASSSAFLNWEGCRRARVMYLDGEMPAETFKERMELIAAQFGNDLPLYGYNRDVLGDGEMPPFNTSEGERWLWREIEAVKPDAIFADSIMCLLAGTMSEEESWAPVKLLMRKISSRRIGQVWLHHTGHDTSKGFGTKTREWEMDTVVSLTEAESAVSMEFKKKRLWTPKTADQFKPLTIVRGENGWTSIGEASATKKSARSDVELIERALLDAYDRLADGISETAGLDGAPVRKVSVEKLRDELKSRGLLEAKDSGGLTDAARKQFQRAKVALLAGPKPRLFENDGLIWR